MAQGKGGGQDSSGEDGMGADAFDGGPQGSPSGDHPDNDPGNNPGVSTNQNAVEAEADAGFDFDNWGGIGIQGASTNKQHPGSHPDQQSIQAAIDQENAVTGLYGAYDNSHLSGVVKGIHSLQNTPSKSPHTGMNLSAAQIQGAVDNFGKSKAQREAAINKARAMEQSTLGHISSLSPSVVDTINNPQNPMETAQVNMQAVLSHLNNPFGVNLSANRTALDQDFESTTNVNAPNTQTTAPVQGYVDPETTTLEAIAQQEHEERQALANNISLDTETTTTAPTTAPTDISLNPAQQKQLDRAIAYETAIKGKTGMLEAFRDLMDNLKEKETKTYFGIEMQVPKMSKYDKEKALVAFRNKYGKQIEAYNKHYSKQEKTYREKPGLFNAPAMIAGLINPILGMVVRAGQAYGYKESDVENALTAAEIDAGIKEADHGDGVDRFTCEAKGYTWNEGLQACYRSDGTLFAGSERSNTGT